MHPSMFNKTSRFRPSEETSAYTKTNVFIMCQDEENGDNLIQMICRYSYVFGTCIYQLGVSSLCITGEYARTPRPSRFRAESNDCLSVMDQRIKILTSM